MKRIIFAIVAAFACNASMAAEPAVYVSASVGSAEQKYSIPGASLTDDDTGFQVAAGYRFTPNFGAELGYTVFGTASATADGVTVSAKPRSFYGAATGTFNVTSQFAVTGKLGVASNRTKLTARMGTLSDSMTESETSVVFGVGASYAVTPQLAVIAEYQNFGKVAKSEADESLKANIVSVGVRYSF